LARIDIDPPDNHHIVAAGGNPLHPADRPTTWTRFGHQTGQVSCSVANHRHRKTIQCCENELSHLTIGKGFQRFWIDDFGIKMIFEKMSAVLVHTFRPDTGTADFCETVNVVSLDSGFGFDLLPHFVRPGFRTEHPDSHRQFPEIDPHFSRLVNDMQKIRGGAGDNGCPKIPHEHHLPFGIAAGNRYNGNTEGLPAIVQPKSAGEKSITVGILQNVSGTDSVTSQCPFDSFCPNGEIPLCVSDDNRLACRATGSMHPNDLIHRDGKETEGIGITQHLLRNEGQFVHIVETFDVVVLHPQMLHLSVIPRAVCVSVAEDDFKFFPLELPKSIRREVIEV
jgi:hypothetical protein